MNWLRLIALALVFILPMNAFAQEEDRSVPTPPKLINDVKAKYTDEAIENRVEGQVKLRITVSANGEVTNVEVLERLGYGLDEAAVEAAEQFEFEPAIIDGQPTAVALSLSVDFSLPILPASFVGRVVDSSSQAGVPARITITYVGDEFETPPTASMETEVDGSFGFENVPPGTYDVLLEVEGYDDLKTDIELVNGQTSEVTYGVDASAENLRGVVRESGTRAPIGAANVQVIDISSGEVIRDDFTDSEGAFGFRGLEPGEYTVRFEASGFFVSTSTVDIEAGQRTSATFYIESEYYDEYSVETTARRPRTEVSKQKLTLDEVRRIPGTQGDVVRVVQNLPGVARAPFVSGLIVVRGSAPQDTKVFLQGDSIPLVYHFFGGPAVINSEMIDSIDFYPGNFSTYYGRATGGIIDITTRKPRDDRFHGMAEIDVLDATALIEGPITDDLSFALSGRRSYFDLFLPLFLPDDGPSLVVAPRYYDYQMWLNYSGFDDHNLQFFVYGSDDAVELLLGDGEVEGNAEFQTNALDLSNSFYRGQFRWEWRPDLPVESTFMASYGVNKASFEAAENFLFDISLDISQIRKDVRFKLLDGLTLRTGVDLLLGYSNFEIRTPRFENDNDLDSDGDGGGRPNFSRDGLQANDTSSQFQPAIYSELEIEPLGDRLLLIPGVRVDHYGQVAATSVQPRFSFRYTFADAWTAKGGVGLFTQPTSPGTEDATFGNPNLTFEKAMQYSAGVEYKPLEYLEFDTTLYYRDLWDLLSNTNDFEVTSDGETRPVTFKNEAEGRAYGAEVLIRHYPQNKFFGWLAYTLSWSERLNLRTGEYFPFGFDQRHILTLVAGYNLPYGFDVSARFRLVTGSPKTPIVDGVYVVDTDTYEPVFGDTNSDRDSTFHQLDLRVDKKFVFDTWILGLYLDVQNVYNRMNEEGTSYNYDFSQSGPTGGLPILPTLGISARF